jgi:hypothetical protein
LDRVDPTPTTTTTTTAMVAAPRSIFDSRVWRKSFFHTPLHEYNVLIRLHGGVVPNHHVRTDLSCGASYFTSSSDDIQPTGSKRARSADEHNHLGKRAPKLFDMPQYKNLQQLSADHVLVGFNPVQNLLRDLQVCIES